MILRGRWGSALEGLTGMWLSNPIPSAEVTGVGWCNQGLGEFYKKKKILQLLEKAKYSITVGLYSVFMKYVTFSKYILWEVLRQLP